MLAYGSAGAGATHRDSRFNPENKMKRMALMFAFVLSVAVLVQAQSIWSFKGTVIKMRMGDCAMQRGFMATLAGVPAVSTGVTCPEYTVTSDKVVYVVVGRRAEDFIPLAENLDFLIRKNDLVLFSDDEKTKSHFQILQMTLRADWDREEEKKEIAARQAERSVNYEVRNPSRASIVATNASTR